MFALFWGTLGISGLTEMPCQSWYSLELPVINAHNIWAPSSEFVSSSIPSWQILTAHSQPFRGARDLAFCLRIPLDSLLVWASSGGSGETAQMRRLAWTIAARIGDKYQIRLTRSIWFYGELKKLSLNYVNYHQIPNLPFSLNSSEPRHGENLSSRVFDQVRLKPVCLAAVAT